MRVELVQMVSGTEQASGQLLKLALVFLDAIPSALLWVVR